MKPRIGDEVLVRGFVEERDHEEYAILIDGSDLDTENVWIKREHIVALVKRGQKEKQAKAEVTEATNNDPAPRLWHLASEPPDSNRSVSVLLPDGEEPGGFHNSSNCDWKWGHGCLKGRLMYERIEPPVIAWREMEWNDEQAF